MAPRTFSFQIPVYTPRECLNYEEMGVEEFAVVIGADEICINANKEGLLTLALFLIKLA